MKLVIYISNKVLEAKKKKETFPLHFKNYFAYNLEISHALYTAGLIKRVIFIHFNSYLFNSCEGMEEISESVFVGMCHIVGTPQKIAIIRAAWYTVDMIQKRVTNNDDLIMMISGSNREGFRLKGSDMDYMF